eukprot:9375275-Pyramimonas_sp.AAC.1
MANAAERGTWDCPCGRYVKGHATCRCGKAYGQRVQRPASRGSGGWAQQPSAWPDVDRALAASAQ